MSLVDLHLLFQSSFSKEIPFTSADWFQFESPEVSVGGFEIPLAHIFEARVLVVQLGPYQLLALHRVPLLGIRYFPYTDHEL